VLKLCQIHNNKLIVYNGLKKVCLGTIICVFNTVDIKIVYVLKELSSSCPLDRYLRRSLLTFFYNSHLHLGLKQARNVITYVTLRCVRVTIVATEKL